MPISQKKYQRATLASIARDLGLATSTVSFCMSGKAAQYGIKAETVQAVRDHADRVGYVVNSAARQLRTQTTPPVGLLFDPRLNAGEMPLKALYQAQEKLKKHGLEVRIVAADVWNGSVQMQQLGCREAIVFSTFTEAPATPDVLEETLIAHKNIAANLKLYAINYSFYPHATPIFPNVVRLGINRYLVNNALCEYLRELDNGKFILQSSWSGSSDSDGTLIVERFPEEHTPYETGRLWAHYYLEMRKKYNIGTIMPGDDRISAGLLSELLNNGVKVPEEVRVISFDNLDFGSCLAVPLTSWGVPMQKHVDMVLDNMLNKSPIPERLVSMPDFTWGASSGFTPVEQLKFMQKIEKICQECNNIKQEMIE